MRQNIKQICPRYGRWVFCLFIYINLQCIQAQCSNKACAHSMFISTFYEKMKTNSRWANLKKWEGSLKASLMGLDMIWHFHLVSGPTLRVNIYKWHIPKLIFLVFYHFTHNSCSNCSTCPINLDFFALVGYLYLASLVLSMFWQYVTEDLLNFCGILAYPLHG